MARVPILVDWSSGSATREGDKVRVQLSDHQGGDQPAAACQQIDDKVVCATTLSNCVKSADGRTLTCQQSAYGDALQYKKTVDSAAFWGCLILLVFIILFILFLLALTRAASDSDNQSQKTPQERWASDSIFWIFWIIILLAIFVPFGGPAAPSGVILVLLVGALTAYVIISSRPEA